jgi:hypothetical protein
LLAPASVWQLSGFLKTLVSVTVNELVLDLTPTEKPLLGQGLNRLPTGCLADIARTQFSEVWHAKQNGAIQQFWLAPFRLRRAEPRS